MNFETFPVERRDLFHSAMFALVSWMFFCSAVRRSSASGAAHDVPNLNCPPRIDTKTVGTHGRWFVWQAGPMRYHHCIEISFSVSDVSTLADVTSKLTLKIL